MVVNVNSRVPPRIGVVLANSQFSLHTASSSSYEYELLLTSLLLTLTLVPNSYSYFHTIPLTSYFLPPLRHSRFFF